MVTEKELIEFDLLRKVGSRWKYRYSIGANYLFASSKESAVEQATQAFRKARPDELLTRDERYEKANQEEIRLSDVRWKHLSLDDLYALLNRMNGDKTTTGRILPRVHRKWWTAYVSCRGCSGSP